MRAVGFNPVDIGREFQVRVGALERVLAAFLEYDSRTNRIAITTLLDRFDSPTENQLATIELELNRTYQDYGFQFSTIHLLGRALESFVPGAQAMVLIDRTRGLQGIGTAR